MIHPDQLLPTPTTKFFFCSLLLALFPLLYLSQITKIIPPGTTIYPLLL